MRKILYLVIQKFALDKEVYNINIFCRLQLQWNYSEIFLRSSKKDPCSEKTKMKLERFILSNALMIVEVFNIAVLDKLKEALKMKRYFIGIFFGRKDSASRHFY